MLEQQQIQDIMNRQGQQGQQQGVGNLINAVENMTDEEFLTMLETQGLDFAQVAREQQQQQLERLGGETNLNHLSPGLPLMELFWRTLLPWNDVTANGNDINSRNNNNGNNNNDNNDSEGSGGI